MPWWDFHKRHAQGRALRRQTGGGPGPARAPLGEPIFTAFFSAGAGGPWGVYYYTGSLNLNRGLVRF
jgi:hypothetical protein